MKSNYEMIIKRGQNNIRSISPNSIRMRENTDQTNSEYGHFLRSVPLPEYYNSKYLHNRKYENIY